MRNYLRSILNSTFLDSVVDSGFSIQSMRQSKLGLFYRAASEAPLVSDLPQLNLPGVSLIWDTLQTHPDHRDDFLQRYSLTPPPTGAALLSKVPNSTPQHFSGQLTKNSAVIQEHFDKTVRHSQILLPPSSTSGWFLHLRKGHRDVTWAFSLQDQDLGAGSDPGMAGRRDMPA